MLYKVGDKVVIRSDLKIGKIYKMKGEDVKDCFVENMKHTLGQETEILQILRKKYVLKVDTRFLYTDEMLMLKNTNPIFII